MEQVNKRNGYKKELIDSVVKMGWEGVSVAEIKRLTGTTANARTIRRWLKIGRVPNY